MHIPPLPISSLPQFIHFHSITTNGISPAHLGGIPIDLGVALTFTPTYDPTLPLLRVSHTLILSHATIEAASKSDRHLHDALSAAGTLAYNPRVAAIIFLLLRMSTATGLLAGERDAWCEYTQYLPPSIPLPTTWTPTELALLTGTSLSTAITAKSHSLTAEFSAFRAATAELAWAQKAWWADDALTLEVWTHADAVYRSRSLELPGHGAAMVPILDFANHADAEKANAYFAIDGEDVVLHLRPGKEWMEGEEVCIDYSDSAKSAAEFVFAYGFIPAGMGGAGGMLLPLQCSEDDPLACAKEMVWTSTSPRGVKISETPGVGDMVSWESGWVYLAITNEEDGLEFQVLQMNDGGRKLQVLLDGEELDLVARPGRIKELLEKKEMWEVFQLRAVTTIKVAVEEALARLLGGRHALEEGEGVECRPQMWSVGTRLGELEETLLLKAAETLAEEQNTLLENPKVQAYLSQQQEQSPKPQPQPEPQGADAVDADGEIDLS